MKHRIKKIKAFMLSKLPLFGRHLVKDKWMIFFQKDIPFNKISYGEGWRGIEFGIMKITEWPPEGCYLSKKYYNGFYIHMRYWLPFEFNNH